MADTRKYGDDEAREIFALATRGDATGTPSLPAAEGLSLAELQAVGQEAGLAPDRIAEAARTIDGLHEVQPRDTLLTIPTGVGRIVELPAAPTDHQWEMLVADMAHTFGGVGKVSGQGNLRQWTNDTVHAFLEPTPDGNRLRITATNSGAMALLGGTGLGFGMGTFFLVVILASGKAAAALSIPILFILAGVLALVANLTTGGRWADAVEEQMDGVATRAKDLIAAPNPAEDEQDATQA